jgi:K+/H+ antiporter YhaU regulatory subunit KhtT
MVPILTLIFVIALSMFVTKAATIALVHTGMSRERARFQARSAFSGAGFTTTESEVVVKHPVRRKIIMLLILLGNAGVVTAISSLILGFVGPAEGFAHQRNIYLLTFGIAFLYFAAKSNRLDRLLEKVINKMLKEFTDIRPKSFSKLMTVMEDFEVTEISTQNNDWLKGSTLADLKLPDEGLLVLGIIRDDNTYIGVPRGRYEIEDTDRLVVYGKAESIADLSGRHDKLAGKAEHSESVKEHQEELQEQDEDVAKESADKEG